MSADVRGRILGLLVAALLVGSAVGIRLWLAATGSYSRGDGAMVLRSASALALAGGFILAAAVVAWPMAKGNPAGKKRGTPERSS